MLEEARQNLEKLGGATKWLDEGSEESDGFRLLGDTISSTLLILLELWIEILGKMRKNPLSTFIRTIWFEKVSTDHTRYLR